MNSQLRSRGSRWVQIKFVSSATVGSRGHGHGYDTTPSPDQPSRTALEDCNGRPQFVSQPNQQHPLEGSSNIGTKLLKCLYPCHL